ncbi:MAG: FHA domain-containing protein [Planctomycetota bacterium]
MGVLVREGEEAFGVQANGSLLVGSGPYCQVRLAAPGVEERHALLEADGDVLTVEDLGGWAGTYVNGKRVGAALLAHGDIIHVGGVRLLFSSVADVPRAESGSVGVKSDGLFSGLRRLVSAIVGENGHSEAAPLVARRSNWLGRKGRARAQSEQRGAGA